MNDIQVDEKYSIDADISIWRPIGYLTGFPARPLQESITGKAISIDELLARYNLLLSLCGHPATVAA